MLFKISADIIVCIHFLWILFLFFGAYWGRKNKTVKMIHLSGLFFALLIQIGGWYCPLTHLEVWLRSKHDPSLTYTGSFISHYVEAIVYMELSCGAVFICAVILCGINGWFYLRKKNKRFSKKRGKDGYPSPEDSPFRACYQVAEKRICIRRSDLHLPTEPWSKSGSLKKTFSTA
jgi:hypothetical protein